MIPKKKKTPEELAALREELGIPDAAPPPPPALPEIPAKPAPPTPARNSGPPPPSHQPDEPKPSPPSVIEQPVEKPANQVREAIVQLKSQSTTQTTQPTKNPHSLRKKELPLAPSTLQTTKTEIPKNRHDEEDIARLRKQETFAKINQPAADPMVRLQGMTARPYLLIPAYSLAAAAAYTAAVRVHYYTPIALLLLAAALAIFIFLKKKRSRHHSAILAIIILMTAAFGTLHYAPLFQNAP